MSNSPTEALLAQLIEAANAAAKQDTVAKAGQALAAALARLFRADRVLVLKGRRFGQVLAADNQAGRLPPSDALDQLLNDSEALRNSGSSQPAAFKQKAWLPLSSDKGLLLQRPAGAGWLQAELRLMQQMAPIFSATLRTPPRSKKRYLWWLLALLLLLVPVPDYVVAPAVVESENQDVVYAPLDGVIESLEVEPGAQVKMGDDLLRYQQRDWLYERQRLAQEQAVAQAELDRLQAAAWQDPQARAALPAQQIRIDQVKQRYDYLQSILDSTVIAASQDGVVQLDDAEALVGSLVKAGQRLLVVADPSRPRLKVYVAVADFGRLRTGEPLRFRSDASPWKGWQGTLEQLGADVQLSEQQQPSLLAWADLSENSAEALSLGERGTVRINSGWAPLIWAIARKPWAAIKQVLQG